MKVKLAAAGEGFGRKGRVDPRCFLVSELEDEDKLQKAEDLENDDPFEKCDGLNGKLLVVSEWRGDREEEEQQVVFPPSLMDKKKLWLFIFCKTRSSRTT